MGPKDLIDKKWLKIAGILSEAEEEEEEDTGDDIFGDEAEEGGDEAAEDEETDTGDTGGGGGGGAGGGGGGSPDTGDEEATDEEAGEDTEEEEEDKEEEEDVEIDDTPTFDTELDKMFSDFEETATVTSESRSLTKMLLEKEKRFDIVAFTDNVARVIKNFTSLIDYEKVVVGKAEKFLKDNHDEEAASMFKELISDRHGIDVSDPPSPGDETPVYSVGAVGGGE